MSRKFDVLSPPDIARNLGCDLKARRLAMNITQQALADRAGVSVSTLKRLETSGACSLLDVVSVAWSLDLREAFLGLVPLPPPTSIDDILKANA